MKQTQRKKVHMHISKLFDKIDSQTVDKDLSIDLCMILFEIERSLNDRELSQSQMLKRAHKSFQSQVVGKSDNASSILRYLEIAPCAIQMDPKLGKTILDGLANPSGSIQEQMDLVR